MAQNQTDGGGNVTSLKEVKNRHRGRKFAIAVILLAAAAAVALNWQSLSPSAAVMLINNLTGGIGNSRFPVSYAQGEFCAAAPMAGDLAVVTDSAFILYSPLGRQLTLRQHGLENPAISASGGKALLYDQGGTQIKVESLFGETFSTTAPYPILSASVNSAGGFAFATSSHDYLSELAVFSSGDRQIFKWYSSSARIISVSLSPNGRRVAALALSAENGDIKTSLYIYDVDQQKPDAVKNFDDVFLFSVQYRGADRICAVGDDRTMLFDGEGNTVSTYSYGDKTLKSYDNAENQTVLAFSRYGIGKESSLVELNADGSPTASCNVDSEIKSVTADGSCVAALTSTGPVCFSADLKKSGAVPYNGDISRLLCIKNNVYLFGPNEITKQAAGR